MIYYVHLCVTIIETFNTAACIDPLLFRYRLQKQEFIVPAEGPQTSTDSIPGSVAILRESKQDNNYWAITKPNASACILLCYPKCLLRRYQVGCLLSTVYQNLYRGALITAGSYPERRKNVFSFGRICTAHVVPLEIIIARQIRLGNSILCTAMCRNVETRHTACYAPTDSNYLITNI